VKFRARNLCAFRVIFLFYSICVGASRSRRERLTDAVSTFWRLADGVFYIDGADAAGLGDVGGDLSEERFFARERDDVAQTT